MTLRVTLSLALLFSLAASAVEPAPSALLDDGGLQQWTYTNGKEEEAYFVALEDSVLTIVEKAPPRATLKRHISTLSQESVDLAKRMASVINVYEPIKDGRFDMGSPDSEFGRSRDETSHEVLTRGFRMKSTEVTWCEWNAIRNVAETNGFLDIGEGNNGTNGRDADLNPVVGITWWDAVKWCNLKSQLEGLTPVYYTHKDCKVKHLFKNKTSQIFVKSGSGSGYRLPTEAEWEFACRTRRTDSSFHTGLIKRTDDESRQRNMDQAGWFLGNSEGVPHPVARKDPNDFKLYDMHGNAAEWCWDYYGLFRSGKADNPSGPLRGGKRVIRGGAWNDPASACRSAARASLTPGDKPDRSVGFRPVLPVRQ